MGASVGEGSGQEVELNLAPIIDCFTVLITYLLVTASFLTLSAIDVGVSVSGQGASSPPVPQTEPPLFMTMDIAASGRITLKISGGRLAQPWQIPVDPQYGGIPNIDLLKGRLAQVKKRFGEKIKDVSVSAEPTVEYRHLVKVVSEVEKTEIKPMISGS